MYLDLGIETLRIKHTLQLACAIEIQIYWMDVLESTNGCIRWMYWMDVLIFN